MTQLSKLFLAIIVFSSVIVSCQDDDSLPEIQTSTSCMVAAGVPVVNYDTVITMGPLCIHGFEYESVADYEYSHPVFNPKNENEMIYFRNNYGAPGIGKQELIKYNFCTEEVVVLTDYALHSIDWNNDDWITYTGYDQNIYKMTANGDSSSQLTYNGRFNQKTQWNDAATHYLYRQEDIRGFLLADATGNILDTIELFASKITWKHNRIFYTGYRHLNNNTTYALIGEYDLEKNEKTVFDSTLTRFLEDIRYGPATNEVLFSNGHEIISAYNLTTGELTDRVIGHDNRTYNTLDLSPDGRTIIASRSNLWQPDDCTLLGDQYLHLIDISGENERELSLPE